MIGTTIWPAAPLTTPVRLACAVKVASAGQVSQSFSFFPRWAVVELNAELGFGSTELKLV